MKGSIINNIILTGKNKRTNKNLDTMPLISKKQGKDCSSHHIYSRVNKVKQREEKSIQIGTEEIHLYLQMISYGIYKTYENK